MTGPRGNENVPVFSYLAKYKDSKDVVINVNKGIGGTRKDLEDYAWKLAEPLGRIPAYIKTGTNRINVNSGHCASNAGPGGTVTMCTDVILSSIKDGSIEE